MSGIHDGGPAFPIGSGVWGGRPGMSLRDWFAGQALNGVCTDHPGAASASHWDVDMLAKTAYTLADAMLKAREVDHSHE